MASYATHLDYLTSDLSHSFPGSEPLLTHLLTLLTAYPPLFIHIHDPTTPRTTAALLRQALTVLAAFPPGVGEGEGENGGTKLAVANVDAVACFSPRLLFDTALNALASWRPRWEDGAACWGASSGERYNDGMDGFMHGLRALRDELARGDEEEQPARGSRKGKGKARAREAEVRMVLVVERAERLREALPELVVPLTRLAELAQVDITTIFLSEVAWEDLKPPLGAAPDPYRIAVPPPSKQTTLEILLAAAPLSAPPAPDSWIHPLTYHPSLQPLYTHFLSALHAVCAPFTSDPAELAYIAAARWPGFAKPVVDAHLLALSSGDAEAEEGEGEGGIPPLPEDARMRLLRYFAPSFGTALDALLPRRTGAAAWARAHVPGPEAVRAVFPALALPAAAALPTPAATSPDKPKDMEDEGAELPRLARFVLVAAYLASTNPPKSDMRMFGRGRDEARRRRRGGGGTARGGRAGNAKVPQRLLGPLPFALDRLLAVLGILLEEYDADARGDAECGGGVPGEVTEYELGRVGVAGVIAELAALRLLQRTTPAERIDGPPMFKCGVSYELAMGMARGLGVPMLELMWEAAG